MKKLDLLKCLILIISVLYSTPQAFSQATTEQAVETSVQGAVAIEKTASTETGSINPATGNISGNLSASFNIQTNETDSYDFYVFAKVKAVDSEESAFDSNGNILFGNLTSLPTATAVSNARSGIAGNADVIGYKMNMTVGTDMTIQFTQSSTYAESYKVNFGNSATTGTLIQNISGSPAVNTYSIGEDSAGTYSTTVYVTAVSKL